MSVDRPTKRERREQARLERERIQQRRRRRARYRKAWIATGVVAAAGIVAAVFLVPNDAESPSAAPPSGVQSFEVASRNHVQGAVDYPQDPPVGGDHNGAWLNCAAYDEPVPNENVVHDLEHGAVSIAYQPDLRQDQVDTLRALASQTFVLVSPYPGLDAPVVASSWGRQIRLQDAGDERLQAFIRAFRQGPNTPELGAPCTGGITPGAGS
jgi:hypothetical protein